MTKNSPVKIQKTNYAPIIIWSFALLVILISSFTPMKDPPKIKTRFYTMLLKKSTIDSLKGLDPNFDHFVFQSTNNEKDGLLKGKRVYMLVVYACKKDGTPINTSPVLLDVSEERIDKDVTDRKEKINLANYTLSKKQYDSLIKNSTDFYAIKIKAVKTAGLHTYKGYVTYHMTVLKTRTEDKSTPIRPYDVDDYLKPSPPARP